jgi:hypothetical protein
LQERAQSDEMVVVQVLLLSTQGRQPARLSVCVPRGNAVRLRLEFAAGPGRFAR